jgi:D-amino peptidase
MKHRIKQTEPRTQCKSMKPGHVSIGILAGLILLTCFAAQTAANPLRIYIVTDLEGASGVYKFTQTREPGHPLGETAMEYLMGDIAAVVRGLHDAQVTDIVLLDGHGSQAFVPHLMERGATYITGKPRPGPLTGLDASFDALIQLGAHAMMGTPDGVLCHTQSSRSENRYWYNGVESGELAQCAAIAGHYDIPTVMVTGDEATCREATKFFGPHCVTVSVKRGISREAAELYPFHETRQALYEGARRAVAAITKCQPYKLSLPIQVKKEYLVFDKASGKSRPVSKEGTIKDVLKLLDF